MGRPLTIAAWYLGLCAGAAWLVLVGPATLGGGGREEIALRISRGEQYPLAVLDRALDDGSGHPGDRGGWPCDERRLRASTLIAVRRVEQLLWAGGLDALDGALAGADRYGRALVDCSPKQALGWLALYWVGALTGARPAREGAALLGLTYALAPRELWIAARRNYLAAAVFPELPADLQEAVVAEFGTLLRAGAVRPAADILAGPAYAARRRFLGAARGLPAPTLSALDRALRENGSGIDLDRP